MLFCGIDIGTTNLKVALVDASGRPAWVRAVPTPRIRDAFGPVTDAAALVAAIEALVIEGWQAVGRGAPLAAIAAAGVGEDGIGLDAGGLPVGPAIPWFDRRAAAEAAEIAAGGAATPRAGIAMDHTRTGAKWLWQRRRAPQAAAATRVWVALTDYPLVAWGAEPFISETLAARTGCYDVGARRWIAALLDACAAPSLPPVAVAGRVVGAVTRGPLRASGAASPATLLVAGGHDHPVASAAIHRLDPAARVDSLGTANVSYGEAPAFVADRLDPLIAFVTPIEGGAGIGCLGVIEFSAAIAQVAAETEIRAFLAEPRLPGVPAPVRPLGASAAGLRALLELATMTARGMFDTMAAVGVPEAPIFATGGWSRSRGLLELRASILDQPVRAVHEPELTVVGAARFAALGRGIELDFRPAVETVDPLPAWADAYQDHYRAFRAHMPTAASRTETP